MLRQAALGVRAGGQGAAAAVLRAVGAAHPTPANMIPARPYSPEPTDEDAGKAASGYGEPLTYKLERLEDDVKEMKVDMKRLMEGTTAFQKAQTKVQEDQGKLLQQLAAGETEYQKTQAATLKSLAEWRTSVVAVAKFTSFLVVAGGAYVKLFL